MKHPLRQTIFLLSLFLIVQILGLFLLSSTAIIEPVSIQQNKTVNESSFHVTYADTAIGERPEMSGFSSVIYIVVAVGIGTMLLLLLVRLKKGLLVWKIWYLLAVTMAMTVTFGVYIPAAIAFFIALLLGVLKIWFSHPLLHNVTEIFVYVGIALILVPLFSPLWALLLLVIISVYDMYAVWKSKHMIALAKFTSQSKLFPGFSISYTPKHTSSSKKISSDVVKKTTTKTTLKKPSLSSHQAILGGGDVLFPLLFAGSVLIALLQEGVFITHAILFSLLISIGSLVALAILFRIAKKGTFYPAMPFITAGCIAGTIILQLLLFVL
ncbi:MAG: presenilin family intramembrane aspartyl protease [Candidatus Nanoarchaeia archaeon]